MILAAGIYKYITTYATRIKARQVQLVSVKGSKKTSKILLRSVRVVSFQNKSMEFETEREEKSYMATGVGGIKTVKEARLMIQLEIPVRGYISRRDKGKPMETMEVYRSKASENV